MFVVRLFAQVSNSQRHSQSPLIFLAAAFECISHQLPLHFCHGRLIIELRHGEGADLGLLWVVAEGLFPKLSVTVQTPGPFLQTCAPILRGGPHRRVLLGWVT